MGANPYDTAVDELPADAPAPLPAAGATATGPEQPAANPYDAAIDQLDAESVQAVRNRPTVDTTSPEKRAEVLRYTAALNALTPGGKAQPSFVEQNLDQVKRQVDASSVDWKDIQKRSPELFDHIAQNPHVQPLIQDDVAHLQGLQWALTGKWDVGTIPIQTPADVPGSAPLISLPYPRLATPPAWAAALSDAIAEQKVAYFTGKQALGLGTEEDARSIEQIHADNPPRDLGADSILAKAFLGPFKMAPMLAGNIAAGAVAGPVGVFAFNAADLLGPAYEGILERKGPAGEKVSPGVAHAGAVAAALAGGAVFTFGIGHLLGKALGPLAEEAGEATIKQIGRLPGLVKSIGAAVGRWGTEVALGATTMAVQSGVENAVEQLSAKASYGAKFDAGELGGHVAHSFTQGLQDMAILASIGPGRQFLAEVGRQASSADGTGRLEAAVKAASESKLLDRSPEEFHRLVNKDTTTVYVPEEAWTRYWQEKKVDPAQAAALVMGDGGKAYGEAKATKGDLAIPGERYLTNLAKTEHGAALIEDAKLKPEDLTPRQVKEEQKRVQDLIKEQATTRGQELEQGTKYVEDFVRTQAVAAGIPKDEAAQSAKLVAEVSRTAALRMGVDVREAASVAGLGELRVLGPRGKEVADRARARFQQFLAVPDATAQLGDRQGTMADENQVREVFIDRNTGLLNEKAFNELPAAKPEVGHISVEGIRYLNSKLTHDKADLLYRLVAKELHSIDPTAAKVGGDFAVQVDDQAELETILQKLRNAMPEQFKGLQITGQAGFTLEAAGKAHGKLKAEAEAAGTRAKSRPLDAAKQKLPPEKPLGLKTETKDLQFPVEQARAEVPAILSERFLSQSKEAKVNEAYIKPGTRILNNEGWHGIRRKAHVAAMDLSGLGDINEKYDHATGNEMIRRFEQVAAHYGGSSFDLSHLHGDEYALQADDPVRLEAYLAKVKEKLQNVRVRRTLPDGDEALIDERIGFHYGIGRGSYDAADADLNVRKEAAKAAAKNDARGVHGGVGEGGQGTAAAGGDLNRGHSGLDQGGEADSGGVDAPDIGGPGQPGRGATLQGFGLSQEAVAGPGGGPGEPGIPVGHIEGRPLTIEQITPSQLEDAQAFIGRKKSPEEQALAKAWLDYTQNPDWENAKRPAVTPKLEKELGKYGVVDPEGWHFDANNRDMARVVGGPKVSRWNDRGMQEQARGKAEEMRQRFRKAGDFDQAAYHGSPHRFEKFSIHKIGTGEGAQSYGWGLYFAGEKQVAEYYRQQLSPQVVTAGGKAPNTFTESERSGLHAVSIARSNLGRGTLSLERALPEGIRLLGKEIAERAELLKHSSPGSDLRIKSEAAIKSKEEALAWLKTLKPEDLSVYGGQLYKVQVPEDHELLDTGKPLSEQSPGVREKLDQVKEEIIRLAEKLPDPKFKGMTAKEYVASFFEPGVKADNVYDIIGDVLAGKVGSIDQRGPQLASEFLGRHGIPGLRYLDQGSRATGEGTHNYVIWDDGRVHVEQTYYQDPTDKGGKRRGFISLRLAPGGRPVSFDIHMLEADRSTFLHETAHFVSWAMHNLATSDIAPKDMVEDYDKLLGWMGYSSAKDREMAQERRQELAKKKDLTPSEQARLDEIVAREEKFSHGFETYLAEGIAPSAGLRGVFSTFAKWMTKIYKGVVGASEQYRRQYGQDLQLSDDVRKIFGRLLAEDSALAAARARAGEGIPFTAARAGMSAAEREQHRKDTVQARLDAEEELAKRWAEFGTDKVDEQRARITDEVTAEMDRQPENRAWRYLETGTLPPELGKGLSNEALNDFMGNHGEASKMDRARFDKEFPGQAKNLPPNSFAAKDGLAPDAMALLLGFNDGAELVKTLTEMEPRPAAIDREVKSRMDDLYGEAFNALSDAAVLVVHNPAEFRAMVGALRGIATQVDPSTANRIRALDPETMMAGARNTIDNALVKELRPDRYLTQEQTSAKAAARAWGAKDKAKAVEYSEAAIVNGMLYREARDRQAELKRAQAKLAGTSDTLRADLGKADPAYRDGHDAIIAAVGLGKEVGDPGAFTALVAQADRDAAQLDFDTDAIQQLVANPTDWKNLTAAQAQNVADAITNIRHVAKALNVVDLAGKRESREALLNRLAEFAGKAQKPVPLEPPGQTAKGIKDKLRSTKRAFLAEYENIETIAHYLDGGDSGPAHDLLVKARLACRDQEIALTKGVLLKLRAAFEKMPEEVLKLRGQRVDLGGIALIPGNFRQEYTRDQLWTLFLNSGNDGNLQRLRDGNRLSDADRQKALSLLTKPETDFLQGVLDSVQSLWEPLAAAHEKRTGLKLGAVKASPITVNGETYRGGYFPIKYRLEARQGEVQEINSIKDLFPTNRPPATEKGHSKERLDKVQAPLDLEFGVVQAHLANVIHDISYSDWVRQAASVIMKPRFASEAPSFSETVSKYLGKEREQYIQPWLRDVASARADSASQAMSGFYDKLGGFGRRRVATTAMAFNFPVMGRHALDAFRVMLETDGISPLRVSQSYLKMLVPENWKQPEFALSKEIAYHEARHAENLRVELQRIGATWGKLGAFDDKVADVGFAAQRYLDHFTSHVTFKAAYDDAIEQGLSKEEAVARGDDVLRRAFPSGDIAEKPPIMRTKRGWGSALMFYGWASSTYNAGARYTDSFTRSWRTDPRFASRAKQIGATAGVWMAVGTIEALGMYLAGRGPKKEDDWKARMRWAAEEAVLWPVDTVGLIGPMVKAKLLGHQVNVAADPSAAYVGNMIDRVGDFAMKPRKDRTTEESAWASLEAILTLGGVGSAAHRTISGLEGISTGKVRPAGPVDAFGDVFYGVKKKPIATPFNH